MSKAVLVLDMPESCGDCKLRRKGYCEPYSWNNALCGVYNNMKNNNKPDWCPLIPIPDKKQLIGDVHNVQSMAEEIAAASWNACIDAIGGGYGDGE